MSHHTCGLTLRRFDCLELVCPLVTQYGVKELSLLPAYLYLLVHSSGLCDPVLLREVLRAFEQNYYVLDLL